MFTKLSSVHSYGTRSVTNENYYVEQVRTENMKRAFSIYGALMWNSIPLSIKTLNAEESKESCIKIYIFLKFYLLHRNFLSRGVYFIYRNCWKENGLRFRQTLN